MEYDDLPGLLRGRLKALGITQRQLAALMASQGAGVSENAVSLWTKGHRRPDPVHLEALMNLLAIYDPDDRARIYRFTYGPESITPQPVLLPKEVGP